MADVRHFKNRFLGHNSAANSGLILVKFCTGKQNSMAIEATWLQISKIQDGRRPPYCNSQNISYLKEKSSFGFDEI